MYSYHNEDKKGYAKTVRKLCAFKYQNFSCLFSRAAEEITSSPLRYGLTDGQRELE